MEKVLSGKIVAQSIFDRISRINLYNTIPTMALLSVCPSPASDFYIRNINRQGAKLGFAVKEFNLNEYTSLEDFIELIKTLNADKAYHGILIQKPFPVHISEDAVNLAVSPTKDIDGIHPENLGRIFLNLEGLFPSTAIAVMEVIKYYNIQTHGKHVVIIGRSPIVAKPLAGFLLQKNNHGNATVTITHSQSDNLETISSTADIIISAIGKPEFVTATFIKKDAVCIDVGINQIYRNGKQSYVGDFDYNSCFDKALAITPVPGGVGSVTTAVLFENLVKATLRQLDDKNC
jgi:methylenetetrahydrofolate dehydrogenase (NADP+)/methenyltetrahydrofolate cyclohydrolase